MAFIFVGANFYRRLLFPFIIIMTTFSSTISMIFALQMNLFYVAFVLSNNLYCSTSQLRKDMINELLIILTIYVLMLFIEQFIGDLETRIILGNVVICITALIFLVNLIPIIFGTVATLRNYIKRKCYKNKRG